MQDKLFFFRGASQDCLISFYFVLFWRLWGASPSLHTSAFLSFSFFLFFFFYCVSFCNFSSAQILTLRTSSAVWRAPLVDVFPRRPIRRRFSQAQDGFDQSNGSTWAGRVPTHRGGGGEKNLSYNCLSLDGRTEGGGGGGGGQHQEQQQQQPGQQADSSGDVTVPHA